VECRLFLDVVVIESASVLELLSGKDESLLVGGDAMPLFRSSALLGHELPDVPFLVLDFGLDVLDSVGILHLEGDGLPGEGFDEYLHLEQLWVGRYSVRALVLGNTVQLVADFRAGVA
jgi:hypothetical protein